MNQNDRRLYLIERLKTERSDAALITVPRDAAGQWRLLRSLINLRPPEPIDREFLQVQDAFLQEAIRQKGVTDATRLPEIEEGVCLW